MENKELLNGHDAVEETIFTEEEFSTVQYDKRIRQARNAIFVVAGAQVVMGTILAFLGPEETRYYTLAVVVFIGAIFVALGFWTKRKPLTAISVALALYAGLIILDAVLDPSTITQGIILKVLILVYLSKGLKDAYEAQKIKNALSN